MALESVFLRQGGVEAEVVPARGGLIARLRVDGTEVLYLDRSTVDDPTKSVRGGIPILFPFAGRLKDERVAASGTTMKQHGFARNNPWTVLESGPAHLRMELPVTDAMRSVWPWEFRVTQSCWLLPRGLHVELTMENRSTRPMPVSPGWHPYYTCSNLGKGSVSSSVPGHDPGRLGPQVEFDFGIPTPPDGRCRFGIPGLGTLRMEYDPAMRHLQHWSLPGKDYICLEPFWGDNDTLNTPARLDIPAGQGRSVWMRVELESTAV